MIQKNVYEFEECCISLLNIDAINKVVLRGAGYRDDANLVYFMSKVDAFELIVKPGPNRHAFDLVTRFDDDENLDFVFGKYQFESNNEGNVKTGGNKRKRLFRGSVKR